MEARSLWLREALAEGFEPAPRLQGALRADVCVIGGGYTGLWTALHLLDLEPSLDVAVVEADLCGGGASGRNGGFVLTWWSKFVTLAKLCGAEEALRLAAASTDAVSEIGAFCARHGIDAGFRQDGWLWAATNGSQVGSWRPTLEAMARHGAAPFREVGAAEAAEMTGSPVHRGGVLEAAGAVVHPARLAFGLRRVARERGVRVFERSPVRVGRVGGRAAAVGTEGSVAAESVVLATNAWGIRYREIRRGVVVVASDMVATEPVPGRLGEIGWTDGLCVSDGRLLVHYYRTTGDGRIAFGKGGGSVAFGGRVGRRFDGPSPRAGVVEAGLRFAYPMLSDVPVATSWTGPIDRSRSGLPFFGTLGGRPDVCFGVGYSGNGVGPSYLGGRILASMALRREDAWSGCALAGRRPAGFPPEPARYAGALAVRSAIERQERAEDAGRRPGPLATALVRLAPSGLVPVKRG